MRAVIKEPNKLGYVTEIKNNLESYQKIVGGYIEVLYHFRNYEKDLLIIANDTSKLDGEEFNFMLCEEDYLAGTCIFISDDAEHEDFESITDDQLEFLRINNFID